MIKNKYVDDYIKSFHEGKILLNKERIMLLAHLQKDVLSRDDLYIDEKMLESYIKFSEQFYFELQPFQKFIAAFVFLFRKEDDSNFYDEFFLTMSRGSGKNGFLSTLSNFFISPLHGIPRYNVSIVANTEKQAKVSFEEIYNAIEAHGLEDHFYKTKLEIKGNDTQSIIQYHTSSGRKDGLRDGCVLYDEVHMMENWDVINIFKSGLGKVRNSREFYIGTNGYIRDGVFDQLESRAMEVLQGLAPDDGLFPYMCKIDEKEEAENPDMWEKACPMFAKPLSTYAKELFRKVKKQYNQLKTNPSSIREFFTKRMNFPMEDPNASVASWENIKRACERELPDLEYVDCIGGLDYANVRDFAAVGLLFRVGDEYVWKSHSFARRGFVNQGIVKIPLEDLAAKGHLTIVEGDTIDIKYIVEWFEEMQAQYGVYNIIVDNFRSGLVTEALEQAGFKVEVLKRPNNMHGKIADQIDTLFIKDQVIFDNPMMSWYTWNVKVVTRKDGNREYQKKDELKSKTDGFHAFIHAFYRAADFLKGDTEILDLDF